MRNNKNIFSVINLIFFLGSFFLCAYIGLSKSTLLSDKYYHEVKLASHNKQDISDINYLLVEENENENEDSFELVGFILPFFISDFEINFLHVFSFVFKPLKQKLSNPIYISVCNFRI